MGKITQYAYDDADRLTSVTDANNHVTQYAYDLENNLTSITDANNHTTSFTYDTQGHLTKTTFPSTKVETEPPGWQKEGTCPKKGLPFIT